MRIIVTLEFRGFAYYYQDKSDWKGLKFVVQTRHKAYTLPMDELPEKWVFLTFTWNKEEGSKIRPKNIFLLQKTAREIEVTRAAGYKKKYFIGEKEIGRK